MPEGAGADDVVPIAGDSTAPDGVDAAAGAARPFVSNNSFDSSGYEALSAAVDELFPIYWMSPPPLPSAFDTDVSIPSDVVPITGDSTPSTNDDSMFGGDGRYVGPGVPDAPLPPDAPPPATAPPVDYSGIDDLIDEVLDRLGAPVDEGLLPTPPPRNPWVFIAIVTAVVLLVAAVIGFALTRGSSSHNAEPAASTTTASTASTASTTTTSASVPPGDVTLSLSLGQVSGRSLPLLVTLQAKPDAPRMTVKVAMTGPGIQPSDTFQLSPGASVTHTIVANGCGSWTVQVVSINGQPVHASGDPNLQNGATHNC
jgi:hypothetical protein